MPKTARNEPCPCGSGLKYKRCCLQKDEAAELAGFAEQKAAHAAAVADARAQRQSSQAEIRAYLQHVHTTIHDAGELADASNAVIDLIDAGKLDEAERAARELLVHYPDVHDGYDRLGMVYQARGQNREAAECYRQAIDFVRAHPQQYEPEFTTTFERLIAELDPSPTP